jgi:hypothetical protein
MGWLSLFLAWQHLNSGTNLRECEDQFVLIDVGYFRIPLKMSSRTPESTRVPGWPLNYGAPWLDCEVFAVVDLNITVFWEVTLQSLMDRSKCSRETGFLPIQGRRRRQTIRRNVTEGLSSQATVYREYNILHFHEAMNVLTETKTKLRGLRPLENYTDQATAVVGEVSAKFCG